MLEKHAAPHHESSGGSMKMRLVLIALLAAFHVAPAMAQSCTAINAIPATITAPGKYCLTNDFAVNVTTGNSITIASNGVTLDCDGHALRNTSTSTVGAANGIGLVSRHDVAIRNCRIIGGYRNGIAATQNNTIANQNYYITLDNNYVAGPLFNGILAYGSGIEVTNNRIYDIGGLNNNNAFGIHLGASTVSSYFKFHLVKDNLVAGTNSPYLSSYGIYSEGTVAGIFVGNGITGTTAANATYGAYGIRLAGSLNRITDNHVVSGGDPDKDFGISTTDTGSACFDNYTRAITRTTTCDATLGNY
jgi:hypothetical protein